MRALPIAIPILCLLSGSCGDLDLPLPQVIDAPTLLAVRTEPVAAMAGTAVEIDALVAAPGDVPPEPRWEICLATNGPSGGFGCLASVSGESGLLASGTGVPVVWDGVPDDDFVAHWCGSARPAGEGADRVVCDGDGLVLTVRVMLGTGHGFGQTSIHALHVTPTHHAGPANGNPGIGDVLASETVLPPAVASVFDFASDESVDFRVEVEPSAAEPLETGDESAREILELNWYASGGVFAHASTWLGSTAEIERLVENELDFGAEDASPPEPGEEVRLWFVLRDGRGGVSWAERAVLAE